MEVSVKINVDRKVWDEFKDYLSKKHGKYRGIIGEEVTNALVQYMKSNPVDGFQYEYKSKTLRIIDHIAHVVENVFRMGKTVNTSWIERWIRVNITPVPSTIKKYMDYLSQVYEWECWDDGYIKPWTFKKKMGEPLWKSEQEYIESMGDKISPQIIKNREKEKEELDELFNAQVIKD